MNRKDLTATVQPGVILMNFAEKVNDLGFMYPPVTVFRI